MRPEWPRLGSAAKQVNAQGPCAPPRFWRFVAARLPTTNGRAAAGLLRCAESSVGHSHCLGLAHHSRLETSVR